MKIQKYWIAVISKEHAMRGVVGSFIQVCHGKSAPLMRMQNQDWIIVYSPKLSMDGTEKLQSFTAIGQVKDEEVYQFKMTENFVLYRRNINFLNSNEVSIVPFIEKLEFIKNKKSWGLPFRFGFFEINCNDFKLIMSKMIRNAIE